MHIGSKAGSNDVFRIPTQAMRSSVHLSRLYTRGIHPSWPDAKCTLLNSFERRMLWCPRWSLAATDICPEASGKGRKCTERVKYGRLVILNRIYSGGCLVVQMGWMTILHAASRKRQYSGKRCQFGRNRASQRILMIWILLQKIQLKVIERKLSGWRKGWQTRLLTRKRGKTSQGTQWWVVI